MLLVLLLHKDLSGFGTLTADIDAGGRIGNLDTLKVEVFNRSILVIDSHTLYAGAYLLIYNLNAVEKCLL